MYIYWQRYHSVANSESLYLFLLIKIVAYSRREIQSKMAVASVVASAIDRTRRTCWTRHDWCCTVFLPSCFVARHLAATELVDSSPGLAASVEDMTSPFVLVEVKAKRVETMLETRLAIEEHPSWTDSNNFSSCFRRWFAHFALRHTSAVGMGLELQMRCRPVVAFDRRIQLERCWIDLQLGPTVVAVGDVLVNDDFLVVVADNNVVHIFRPSPVYRVCPRWIDPWLYIFLHSMPWMLLTTSSL